MEAVINACITFIVIYLVFAAPSLLVWVLDTIGVMLKVFEGYRPTSWKAVFRNTGILLVDALTGSIWRGDGLWEYEDETWYLPEKSGRTH